jgi:hypothetical protein
MDKLEQVIGELKTWQVDNADHTHRCLEAVRWATGQAGLRLPMSNVDYAGDLAIECGQCLVKDPGEWGWKLIYSHNAEPKQSQPTVPCLAFFDNCGALPDGREAGHVAILDPAVKLTYANQDYPWDTWWEQRLAFAFIPE